jgi:hypothetical protein
VNQLPKSVVREIRTPRSVGAGGGRPPPATRWARGNSRPYRESRHGPAKPTRLTQLGRSLAEMGEHRTKVPMISTLDDIWRKGSKRASSTSILASLYRLSMIPFQLVHQSI